MQHLQATRLLLLALVFFSVLIGYLILKASVHREPIGPEVTAVYPSADVLPANLLRLYIQFSEPMKTTGNLEHIKLLDETGTEVPVVFFDNVYELWNQQQTQLTLIVDPARVKTGLLANEELGRALVPGARYSLIIDQLQNALHQPLRSPFEKAFLVEPADVSEPKLERWKIQSPENGSNTALIVRFPEPLDYLSLLQRLIVTTLDNKPVAGKVEIGVLETTWQFTPAEPWKAGEYKLHVHTRLEDPSGNNLSGLFDHAIGDLRYQSEGQTESISFIVN